MNPKIQELALKASLINYVDLETPRHYFICGYAETKHLEQFAQDLIRYLIDQVEATSLNHLIYTNYDQQLAQSCKRTILNKLQDAL
jgi:hypothetical protein